MGLLKFMRNVNVHRAQMVDFGRFESEEALQHYLLDPFPWLLVAVWSLDAKHELATTPVTPEPRAMRTSSSADMDVAETENPVAGTQSAAAEEGGVPQGTLSF